MVRAKMTVGSKIPYHGSTQVQLYAVYSTDPNSENKAFTDATPSASLNMMIQDDKPALALFEIGKSYYVDFTPAE